MIGIPFTASGLLTLVCLFGIGSVGACDACDSSNGSTGQTLALEATTPDAAESALDPAS